MEEQKEFAVSLIDGIEMGEMRSALEKIAAFQKLVQSQLKKDLDFGVIPGTKKPSLLKPGAEKITMLLGLRSEFIVEDHTRDFDKGFFQYQVKAKLFKGDVLITEGLGTANNRETKWVTFDPYTVDNTILKMAKKRAHVDAALTVGSLSDIFSQDLDDLDITGTPVEQKRYATDQDGTISKAQAKRMFAIAKGKAELVKTVLSGYGYKGSDEVKKIDYETICSEIEGMVKSVASDGQN